MENTIRVCDFCRKEISHFVPVEVSSKSLPHISRLELCDDCFGKILKAVNSYDDLAVAQAEKHVYEFCGGMYL